MDTIKDKNELNKIWYSKNRLGNFGNEILQK